MRFLIVFLFFSLSIKAQDKDALHTSSAKAERYYQKAQSEASRRNYKLAQQLLDEAIKKDDQFVEAYFLKGIIYNSYGERETAFKMYEKVIALEPDDRKFRKAHFFVGMEEFENGNYENAKNAFQKYLFLIPGDKRSKAITEEKIKNCDYAMDPAHRSDQIKPERLDEVLNKFQYQYFPVLTADQEYIFFTARDDISTEDIFVSRFYDGKWVDPQSISPVINTPAYNEGTCTVSGDGRMIVFTSCNSPGGRGRCDLYIAFRSGNKWTKPNNMGLNVNSKYWDSQPSLSADGRHLYFSSDRPGGKGRMDIWVSSRDNLGRWSPARNVGAPINTSGEEFSPVLHPSNKALYYATNGYDGFGGLDLFYSLKEDGKWSKPENLGAPINTWKDEVAFFVAADGKTAYYSTNEKDEKGARSFIYRLDLPARLQLKNKSYSLKGTVYDKETKKKLRAQIDLIDLETDETEQSVSSDPSNGEYLIVLTEGAEYGLFVSREGYLFESLNFNLKDSDASGKLNIDIALTPINVNASTIMNNIFFDFGKASLRSSSIPELEKLIDFLRINENVRIEIGGHTDNIGSIEDNQKLSEDRAKAVRDFLVGHKVPLDRLSFKGYGESKPVADNNSEENRQRNRRIEFTVLTK
ncbi:MAG: OmpA family protein [Cytophagales bacterium]